MWLQQTSLRIFVWNEPSLTRYLRAPTHLMSEQRFLWIQVSDLEDVPSEAIGGAEVAVIGALIYVGATAAAGQSWS